MSLDLWKDDGKGHRGKCTPGKRCPAMRVALDRNAAGLTTATLLTFATGQCRTVVVYRLTARDGGCAVEFCPFCGGRVGAKRRAA